MRRAFTLIELLVVMAIIAVLAAILFPVFAQARESARAIACISNSHQLAIASYMYTQDWNETIPPASNYGADPPVIWSQILMPYIGNEQIFICPSSVNAKYPADWSLRGYGPLGFNSSTSYDPSGVEAPSSVMRLTSMDEPARSVLLADTPSGDSAAKYRGYVFDPYNDLTNTRDARLSTPLVADHDLVADPAVGGALPPAKLKPVYCRHHRDNQNHGKASLVFADSHAKAYSAAFILGQDSGANLFWRLR